MRLGTRRNGASFPFSLRRAIAEAEKQMAQAQKAVKQGGKDMPKPILKDFEIAVKKFNDLKKQTKGKSAPSDKLIAEIMRSLDKASKTLDKEAQKIK